MEEDYGIIGETIQTPMGFNLKMGRFCEKIVTISYIDPLDLSFEIEEDNQEFWWDTGMVKAPNNSIAALLEERYKYEF